MAVLIFSPSLAYLPSPPLKVGQLPIYHQQKTNGLAGRLVRRTGFKASMGDQKATSNNPQSSVKVRTGQVKKTPS